MITLHYGQCAQVIGPENQLPDDYLFYKCSEKGVIVDFVHLTDGVIGYEVEFNCPKGEPHKRKVFITSVNLKPCEVKKK